MEGLTLKEFKTAVKHSGKKSDKYTVNNSWGVYDFYKYYRKNKPEGKRWVLTESQYFAIFRRVNELLMDILINTGEVQFPFKMGGLLIYRRKLSTYVDNDGNKRTERKIDWNRTLELWYDDAEAYKNKTLLYYESDEKLIARYTKEKAEFINKYYYDFRPNRDIARRVRRESVVSYIINRDLQNQIKGLYDG